MWLMPCKKWAPDLIFQRAFTVLYFVLLMIAFLHVLPLLDPFVTVYQDNPLTRVAARLSNWHSSCHRLQWTKWWGVILGEGFGGKEWIKPKTNCEQKQGIFTVARTEGKKVTGTCSKKTTNKDSGKLGFMPFPEDTVRRLWLCLKR